MRREDDVERRIAWRGMAMERGEVEGKLILEWLYRIDGLT